jgi:hypothetical protein
MIVPSPSAEEVSVGVKFDHGGKTRCARLLVRLNIREIIGEVEQPKMSARAD